VWRPLDLSGLTRDLALGLLVAAQMTACSAATREKVASVLFDGVVQDEPPPRRRTRRDLLREIEELKQELARVKAGAAVSVETAAEESPRPAVEEVSSWGEAAELLPSAADGEVDWAQALRDGIISPRAGVEPGAAPQQIFAMDVERVPAVGEMFKVLFPHGAHTEWLTCPSCHPEPFAMQKGATPMSMERINAGEQCGICHGTVAFSATACGRCHPAMAAPAAAASSDEVQAAPAASEARLPVERAASWAEVVDILPKDQGGDVDWAQALRDGTIDPRPAADPAAEAESVLALDVERVPDAGGDTFKVVFSHEAHTEWLTCPSCHPEPFAMQQGGTAISMDQINAGEQCGMCHGTVAFPATACARCHPGLGGG
jgi:c(7)-type cytochrome triheme protein